MIDAKLLKISGEISVGLIFSLNFIFEKNSGNASFTGELEPKIDQLQETPFTTVN